MNKMHCPYCHAEMEKGVVQSPHEISWQSKRRYFGRAAFYDDAVVLSELNIMRGSAVEAWLCRDCKKVIIDYSEKEE